MGIAPPCRAVIAHDTVATGPVDRSGLPAVLADRYEVGSIIGRGGTAEVYRAWDRVLLLPVAVKLFTTPALRGHHHEIAVLRRLRHPGVVRLHNAGQVDGWPFAVMDLVDGPSLGDALRSGPLDARAVAGLGSDVAGALAHVHACGVVHRDVKPGNVLLDVVHGPRLVDFGLARIVDAARVTTTGAVVGTPAYMAPEQVRGGRVGAPADIYSLGLVLLEAVTGRREYGGGLVESAVARLHRDPVVPTSLPAPLAEAIVDMTAPEAAWRPCASAVVAALRHSA